MKEILIRLTNPSPKFFQRLLKLSLTIGAVGGMILTFPASLPAGIVIAVPAIVNTAAGYMVAVGTAGTIISKLTVENSEVLPKKEDK